MALSFFKRPPDFIIGGADNPYLLRWWLLPRNPLFNMYLHKFLRDDDDRALHDHPWPSLSIIIKGSYIEHLQHKDGSPYWRHCRRWSVIFRRATHRHRIELIRAGGRLNPSPVRSLPTWTIFITGPRLRQWGFWCPSSTGFRFVHWRDFTASDDKGAVGKGCNQ